MVYLHGLGHFHPENVITNRFLVDLDIGTTEDWIMERVGIETRRTILPLDYLRQTKNADPRATCEARLYSNAQMGARAARMALERAGLSVDDIGMVISGSSVPEFLTPSEAATVAGELGIDVPCFDINNACTTFGVQMNFLDRMRPETLPPYILVLNIEGVTPSIDFSDRRSAVLFGDASTAAVVSATIPADKAFVDCTMDAKPTLWDKIQVERWRFFSQDGSAVQGFAIRKTTDGLRAIMASAGQGAKRLFFIGHQANLGVLRTACERSGLPEASHWHNVTAFGNTGCAGAPATLSQHWDELRPGDCVAMALVGGGLTWTRMALQVRGEDVP
jgi:3-oxoacyl-[acyl-carrier-protein] synthase-3